MQDPPAPQDRGTSFRLTVNGAEVNWRAMTRGQLRALLAALGVSAIGGAPCPE